MLFFLLVLLEMVFSDYAKQRILNFHWKGYKVSEIVEFMVLEDQIRVSKNGVRRFLKWYATYGTIGRKPGSGLPPKLSPAIEKLIEDTMHADDETTATQLQSILASRSIYVSLATILRNRSLLGWIYRGSAYCQLIRHANKLKRLQWAQTYLHDSFDGVTKLLFSLKITGAFVIERKERNLGLNLARNIRSRFMFGVGSARREQLLYASLKESWLLHYSLKFLS